MSLYHELKRRNVFRVAIAYLAGAWLLIEVTDTIFPYFNLGETAVRVLIILLAIGFPMFLVFSWVFEITPEGLLREKDVQRGYSITAKTGKTLNRVIIVLLGLALGYFAFDKFILDPVEDEQIAQSALQEGRSAALTESYGDNSIAVLPFVNMSSDPEQEYFSDGISEELLNLLAKIPELRVISRSSAFSFKGKDIDIPTIAGQLNVAHILEGSVRKAGNQVRITTQLIDARSDTHLWSETYDRTFDDIFAVQNEIAVAVVENLKIAILGEIQQIQEASPEAYALYLQGRHLMNLSTSDGLERAAATLKKSLEIDPNYSPTWLELGRAYDRMSALRVMSSEEARPLARDAINRALELSPNSGRVHDSLAWRYFYYAGDMGLAAAHFERAMELDPTNTNIIGNVSIFLSAIGRSKEAIRFGEHQVSRDPANAVAHNNLGIRYRYAGQFDKTESAFLTALTLNPGFIGANYEIGVAQLMKPDFAAAERAFERESAEVFAQIGLAMTAYTRKNVALSDQIIDELTQSYGDRLAYYVAQILAFRGEVDEAFEWLDKARLAIDRGLVSIINEPLFANLHDDPRWYPFLESIGKSPAQLAAIEFDVALPE